MLVEPLMDTSLFVEFKGVFVLHKQSCVGSRLRNDRQCPSD